MLIYIHIHFPLFHKGKSRFQKGTNSQVDQAWGSEDFSGGPVAKTALPVQGVQV